MTYICSCSGGKDSVATIILAHEKGYPLDEVIFSEVMFDENISGELPEHIDFIKNTLKPKCEEWGYKFTIVRASKTYMDCFNHVILKSKDSNRIGKKSGFPMQGRCVINRDCKVGHNHLYHHHRDLFEKLKALENEPNIIGYCWNTLTKTSIYDVEQDILAHDAQLSLFEE